MRTLFLDVDGVLNCHLLYEEQHRWEKFKPSYWWWKLISKIKWLLNGCKYKSISLGELMDRPDPPFKERVKHFRNQTCQKRLGWLDELCKEMDLKIVISSVWRRFFTLEEWNKVLQEEFGFKNLQVIGITETKRTLRGDEIKDWMDKYGPVDNFVIIDDDSDMREDQMKHFFQTDNYSGITPNTLYKIKRFLTGEDEEINKKFPHVVPDMNRNSKSIAHKLRNVLSPHYSLPEMILLAEEKPELKSIVIEQAKQAQANKEKIDELLNELDKNN